MYFKRACVCFDQKGLLMQMCGDGVRLNAIIAALCDTNLLIEKVTPHIGISPLKFPSPIFSIITGCKK